MPAVPSVRYGAPLMCSKTRTVTQWRRERGCLTRTVSGGMCVKWEDSFHAASKAAPKSAGCTATGRSSGE